MSLGVVSTGSKVSVSAAAPGTVDVAGYDLVTWTEWTEVTQIGDIGPTSNILKYNTVGDGLVNKRAGSKDYGAMAMEAAYDATNAAQIIIQAAVDTVPVPAISVKIELPTTEILYMQAYPTELKTKIGGADSILMAGVNIEVDGSVISKPAA